MEHTLARFKHIVLGQALILAQATPVSMASLAPKSELPAVDTAARRSHALELATLAPNAPLAAADAFSAEELGLFVQEIARAELPARWKSRAPQIAATVIAEAKRRALDPLFLLAVMKHESRFNPEARGAHGEIGLMQVKPSTAAWVTRAQRAPAADLHDPCENIRVGAALFSILRDQFKSDADLYIGAYNMGAQNVRNLLKDNRRPQIYPEKVMKEYQSFYRRLDTIRVASGRGPRADRWLIAGMSDELR